MKTVSRIALSLLLSTATAHAAGTMPEGHFKGEGLWKSTTEQGSYQVQTKIQGDRIESSYQSKEGNYVWEIELKATANGFFKVLSKGQELGSGYCLEQAKVCHYELNAATLALEETLVYQDGKLFRFGSKNVAGAKVFWQEKQE
jgi:hypothetical protein